MVKINRGKSESLRHDVTFFSPSRTRKGKNKQDKEDLSTDTLSSEIDRLINSSSIGKEFHYVPKYREHEAFFLTKEKILHGDKKRKSGSHSHSKSIYHLPNEIKKDNQEDSTTIENENENGTDKNGESSVFGGKETNNINKHEVKDTQNTTPNEIADLQKKQNMPNSTIPYLECDDIDENILQQQDLSHLDTDDTYEAFNNDIILAPSFSLSNNIVKKDISFSKSSADVLPPTNSNSIMENIPTVEKKGRENALKNRNNQDLSTEREKKTKENSNYSGIQSTESRYPADDDSVALLEKFNDIPERNCFKADEDENIASEMIRRKNAIEMRLGITMTLGRSLEESLGSSAAARRHNILRIKIISMGPAGCGKSCLIKRFCERRFITKYITTIGVDYGVHRVPVDRYDVRVNFWDLSGQREFFEIRNEFYKDAQGALLVFDSTNRQTFEELEEWIEEIKIFGGNMKIPNDVCNNKIDKLKNNYESLLENEFSESSMTFKKKKKNLFRTTREVSQDEAEVWCKFRGYHYFETSAATNENVDEMFQYLFEKTVEDVKQS